MIIYRVEYKQNITKYWSEMEEFSNRNQAVEYAKKQADEPWFEYYDFRIIKRTVDEEEVLRKEAKKLTWTEFQKEVGL